MPVKTTEETIKMAAGSRRGTPEITLRQEGDKQTLRFPVSSEEPVESWFGKEVLAHGKNAVRLDRVENGAVPLLFNHKRDDPIGIIEDAWVEKKRLWVEASLFETARAQEVNTMIEGGLRNVSIGYRIHVLEENKDTDTFTATDWEPIEVSIASIPADPTVGIGREEKLYEVRMIRPLTSALPAAPGGSVMPKETGTTATAAIAEPNNNNGDPPVATGERTIKAVAFEQARKRAIENLCKANQLDAKYREHWIGTGADLEQVSDDILGILEERGKTNPQPLSRLGLSSRETQQFSLIRAIRACLDKDWTMAPFELECTRALQKKLGRVTEPGKFLVPFEVMERPVEPRGQRDLTAAVAGAGGFLVETDNVGFIEILRNRSVAFRLGARRLSGLQGNVTIPRQSAAANPVWLTTESSPATESQQTFVQVALTPKTVGAYTEISRQLLLQSAPSAEGIVMDDLAQVVALAADLAVINGSGAAGQPTGILQTAGIGGVSGTTLGYPGILEFQVDVAAGNVVPMRGGYVTTPAVASLMMQRQRFTSTDTPLWVGNLWDGRMAGFPSLSSNQIPAAQMLFGDWQEVVVAEWGVLEVEVNPYANFPAGILGIRALYSLDVGLRRPFAFSEANTIT